MLHIHFPAALALVPLAVGAVLLLLRGSTLSGARRGTALGVRIVAVSLLGFAGSAPSLESQTRLPHHVTFVLDASASVPDAALERGMKFVENESKRLSQSGHLSSLVLFAGQASVIRSPMIEAIRFDQPLRARTKDQRESLRAWNERLKPLSTRFGPALGEARWLAPVHAKHTIVLLTDGFAEDLARTPLNGALLQPLSADHPQVCVRSAQVPLWARYGEPFGLHLQIASTGTTSGILRVSVDGEPKPELERKVDIAPGTHSLIVPHVAGTLTTGLHRIEAFLEIPDDPDRANKAGSGLIHILGKPRVLLLRERPGDEKALEALLRLQDMDVAIESPARLPDDLNAFDSIVVIGAPDPSTPEDTWSSLRSYVNDLGGGLLFVGHPKPGLIPKGLEDLLPVAFDPPPAPANDEPKNPPPPPVEPQQKSEVKKVLASQVTLLVLIDKSGSMAGTNIGLAKQACLAAVKALSENDYVGVIAFDGRPHWVVKPTLANGIKQIEDDIIRLYASGGTNIYNALIEAEAVMNQANTPIRHILLLSDGETSPANFEELAQRMAKEGITISTITLLEGNFDLALMRSIAENGKGRYLWAKDARSLPQIFTHEVQRVVGKSDKPNTGPAVPDPLRTPKPADPVESKPKEPKRPPELPPFQPVARGIHESIQGIDFNKSPFLRGMLPGKPKASSLVPLVSNRDEKPVLAFWRVGLGKAAAWTPDFGSDWSGEFVAWAPATKMMAQIVRAISSNLRSSSLYTKIRRDGLRLTVDAPDLTASLPVDADRSIAIPPLEPGQELHITIRSGEEAALVGVIGPAPEEHLTIGLNPQIFDRTARPMDTLVLGEDARETRSEDLVPWLLIPAVLLLTLDLLIRRIRL